MPTEFLQAYLTATDEQRTAALDALKGRTAAAQGKAAPLDRILSRDEVADILKCSTKSVTRYGKKGIIRPIYFGAKGKKSLGYSESSVRAALEKANAKPAESQNR